MVDFNLVTYHFFSWLILIGLLKQVIQHVVLDHDCYISQDIGGIEMKMVTSNSYKANYVKNDVNVVMLSR